MKELHDDLLLESILSLESEVKDKLIKGIKMELEMESRITIKTDSIEMWCSEPK